MSDLTQVAAGVLLLTGAVFALLASIGVLRMPDALTRMQASTKAGTLGVALSALGAAAHFGTLEAFTRALLVVVFLFATAPVAAHLIARAAARGAGGVLPRLDVNQMPPAPEEQDEDGSHEDKSGNGRSRDQTRPRA